MRWDADAVTELHQTPLQDKELGIDGETVSSLAAHAPAILLGFGFYYSIVYMCIMGSWYRCLWRPEESFSCSGNGVSGCCELLDIGAGPGLL